VCCLLHVPSAACGPSCLLVHETLRVVLGLGSLDSSAQLATQAAELQREAKEKAEHETKKADAKAASPGVARLYNPKVSHGFTLLLGMPLRSGSQL